MISLIIPTYKNPDYLDLCLQSAVDHKQNEQTEIIVVVDGFVELSRSVISKYPTVRFIEFDTNQGMQHALNVGVMASTNPLVFIINDDNVLPVDWDVRACYIWKNVLTLTRECDGDDMLVLTINQVEPHGPGMFNFVHEDFGTSASTFDYTSWLMREIHISKNQLHSISHTGNIFPFIIQKKHYMAVGGFDTLYDSPNLCDWDFFLKLQLLQFTSYRSMNMHLYHFGSVATKKNPEASQFTAREAAAALTYKNKWGIDPYNEPGTNNKIPNPAVAQLRGIPFNS